MLGVFPLLCLGCLILPGGFDDSLEMFGAWVQVNGVGCSLYCLRYRIRNSFSSFLERCTLCVNACRVRMLKKHSTMFIQEACVGG
jgi:hypothetical protein